VRAVRILWLAPEPPIPPLTGGRERARCMLTYLGARHRVHLLTLAEPADAQALAELQTTLDGVTAIPYRPRSRDNPGALRAALEELIPRWLPDSIHVQGLDAWPGRPPGNDYVLDLHDVPSLLEARLLALQPQRPWPFRSLPRRRLTGLHRLERLAVGAARAVIVASQDDARVVVARGCARLPVTVLPNGVDSAFWSLPGGQPPGPTVLFPGALNWPPNIDAARVLATSVLPLLQEQLADVRLVIAGRRPGPSLVALAAADPAVRLLPDPDDMRPIFSAATVIAVPLRAATGSRLKILQALAAGRPVVSTPAGAAGLELQPERHLLVAPLVEPFANAVAGLLKDPAARARLVAGGHEAVRSHGWQRLLPALDAVYPPDGVGS
jgi:glycosyltransferase involved in cell wall biosynthesis